MPDEAAISRFYPSTYYGNGGQKFTAAIELVVGLLANRRINFLTRGLRQTARILDVGCGRGLTLKQLADRGFEVFGLEHSQHATQGIDERIQVRIARDLQTAAYPNEHFDLVIIWHVLEHLIDPVATLREARRILRPSGRLIVAVPNYSSFQARWTGTGWFHLDLPRHLYQFPASGLKRLISAAGFDITAEHHFSLRYNPFGWVQSVLNQCAWLPRNGLYELLHQAVPGIPSRFTPTQRLQFLLAYAIGMPVGLVMSVFDAFMKQGATIHCVATPRSAIAATAADHMVSMPKVAPISPTDSRALDEAV